MDTNECQPLYIDIQEFYEGMNMKVEQQVPLLLVERQALNEAMEAEKMVSHISIHYHVVYIATSNIILLLSLIRDTTFLKPEVSAYLKNRLSKL